MSTYPIEATSISFNDIKQNLIDFVKAKPDANRWRDFYTGGEGVILIELIAGYGFYTAMKIIFSREETYLHYANTLLSARAIALNCAYSAYRGTNRRYRVKFVPNTTISIPAFTVIGYQGDYDFICLEDTVLNEGEETTVYGAVGVFSSLSLEAPSADLHVFRFNDDLISEDYKLYLNDNELPTTSVSAEALEDKYLVQSNAVGGVNVTYLNLNSDFEYKYQTGDILRLDYVRYQNIPYSSEINIDYAEADTIEIVSTENPVLAETIESIQTKAPIMYETQQLVRSREDYVKNFLQLRAKFADTTGRDLSPAYVDLSYCQQDKTLMTEDETSQILKALTYKRMFGIPMPYINKPRFMTINLKVDLRLNSSNIALTEYNSIVANTFSDFELKFSDDLEEVKIDLAELERLLEGKNNVKRASIVNNLSEFKAQEFYQLGDTFYDSEKHPDILYRVTNITYTTLATEPKWNYTLGSTTSDGNIIWEAIPKSGYPVPWTAKEDIRLYDLRVPQKPEVEGIMFRAIQGKSVTAPAEEPEWNTNIGDLTYDNELIWQTIEYVATAKNWDSNTWFNLGDIIKSGSSSFQVIGERRKSSSLAPTIPEDVPDEIIYQNMVLTKEVIKDEIIQLPWGTYCIINPEITAGVQ